MFYSNIHPDVPIWNRVSEKQTTKAWRPTGHEKWSHVTVDAVISYRKMGWKNEDIAKELGCSVPTINSRIAEYKEAHGIKGILKFV